MTLERNSARISRRAALKAGATFAAGVAGGTSHADAAADVRRFVNPPAVNPMGPKLIKGGTIVSMDAKVGDLLKGDILIEGTKISAIGPNVDAADAQVIDAGDMHRRAGLRRLPPPFLGRATAPHQSQFADARRLYERDASVVRQGVPAARHYVGNLSDGDRLHRRRHHLRDRQFAQFAQRRAFRCGDRGAVRQRHPRRSCFGRAAAPAMGSPMAAGSGAAAEAIFLVGRSAGDLAHVLRAPTATTGRSPASSGCASPPSSRAADGGADRPVGGRQAGRPRQHLQPLRRAAGDAPGRFSSTAGANIDVCPRSDAQYGLGEGVCALQHAWTTASSRASASTTRPPTAPTCSWRCASRFYLQRAIAQNRRFSRRSKSARSR